MKRSSGKGVLWADIYTCSTVTALRFHRRSCWAYWGISQNADPPDPGPVIRSDKQAALPDPAHSSKVSREFLGEDAADILIGSPFRRGDWERTMSSSLELVCHPDADLVEYLVDDIVGVVPVQDCTLGIL